MAVESALQDIFTCACDSYLDAISCKKYSSIFTRVPGDEFERMTFDSRQDDESFRNVRCDDSEEESQWIEDVESQSLSGFRLPVLLPLKYLVPKSFQVDTRKSTSNRRKNFPRAYRRIQKMEEPSCTSEYSEFCTLCRCRAWSQDSSETSNNSLASKTTIGSSSLTTLREMMSDSLENRDGEILEPKLEKVPPGMVS